MTALRMSLKKLKQYRSNLTGSADKKAEELSINEWMNHYVQRAKRKLGRNLRPHEVRRVTAHAWAYAGRMTKPLDAEKEESK